MHPQIIYLLLFLAIAAVGLKVKGLPFYSNTYLQKTLITHVGK